MRLAGEPGDSMAMIWHGILEIREQISNEKHSNHAQKRCDREEPLSDKKGAAAP